MTDWIITAHGKAASYEDAVWLKDALTDILSEKAVGAQGSNMDSDAHRGPLHLGQPKPAKPTVKKANGNEKTGA